MKIILTKRLFILFLLLETVSSVLFSAEESALLEAVKSGKLAFVSKAIKSGALVNISDAWSSLFVAVEKDDSEIVKILLENGADVHKVNNNGTPPLSFAHSREIAELLIKHNADVNKIDHFNRSVLDHAILYHKTAIAELLRLHGATEPEKRGDSDGEK